MNRPNKIIIHHSATKDSGTVSWGAIRRYHRSVRGWTDVGYHAGCEDINGQYECLYGRPWHIEGAHTQGHNRDSLGFCFVGDYDVVEPEMAMMLEAVVRVIAPWALQFDIGHNNVRGHNEFSSKTCPGALFPMDLLREMVRTELEEYNDG